LPVHGQSDCRFERVSADSAVRKTPHHVLRENVIGLFPFVLRPPQPFGRIRVHGVIVIVRIVAATAFGSYLDALSADGQDREKHDDGSE